MTARKIVITGGPHSGKTSVLDRLRKRGLQVIPEVPRGIIAEQQQKERMLPGYEPILPGARQEEFNQLVIQKQIESESKAREGTVFLDRSLVDPIAYAEFHGSEITPDIHGHISNAEYDKVFFLEKVPGNIRDGVRLENPEEAEKLHQKLFEVYTRLGFDISLVDVFELGNRGIEKRVKHIMNHLEQD